MQVLVTGITGYVGSVVAARLRADGHEVRGFARSPERVTLDVPVVAGDAVTGQGLAAALDGVEVAYFLIHGMEPAGGGPFASREQVGRRAIRAGGAGRRGEPDRVPRWDRPAEGPRSPHLASRLAVEDILLDAVPDVGGAARIDRDRSPVALVPLPGQAGGAAARAGLSGVARNRTAPIDERDMVEVLARCRHPEQVSGMRLDVGGPDILSYGELIQRIADLHAGRSPGAAFQAPDGDADRQSGGGDHRR